MACFGFTCVGKVIVRIPEFKPEVNGIGVLLLIELIEIVVVVGLAVTGLTLSVEASVEKIPVAVVQGKTLYLCSAYRTVNGERNLHLILTAPVQHRLTGISAERVILVVFVLVVRINRKQITPIALNVTRIALDIEGFCKRAVLHIVNRSNLYIVILPILGNSPCLGIKTAYAVGRSKYLVGFTVHTVSFKVMRVGKVIAEIKCSVS